MVSYVSGAQSPCPVRPRVISYVHSAGVVVFNSGDHIKSLYTNLACLVISSGVDIRLAPLAGRLVWLTDKRKFVLYI